MINYDTARGGITVDTVPGPRTQSRLTIRDTNDADSGNYTCSASNTEPASIYVFVSEGKNRIRSYGVPQAAIFESVLLVPNAEITLFRKVRMILVLLDSSFIDKKI